jgi:alkylated DNA repair dioxygenase AlkB
MEYTYGSGRGVRTYRSIPYLPTVEDIQRTLNSRGARCPCEGDLCTDPSCDWPETPLTYNVCFLNRYGNAGQHLGWHADDSPGMDHEHPIAVVSFGQPREIWWREHDQKGVIPSEQRQLLASGSLFVMPPGFQRTH